MRKNGGNIKERLTNFLFHYRTTVQGSTNQTPASLLFGRELRTKLTFVQPDAGNDHMEPRRPLESERFFVSGDSVLARDFVSGKENRWGIGEVMERLGRCKYKVRLANGIVITRHVDALKHVRRCISHGKLDEVCSKTNSSAPKQLVDASENVQPSQECERPFSTETEDFRSNRESVQEPEAQLHHQESFQEPQPQPRRNPKRHCGPPVRYQN